MGIEETAALFAAEVGRAGAAVGILSIPGFRQVPPATRSFLAFLLAIACFFAKWGNPATRIPQNQDFWLAFAGNIAAGLFAGLIWNVVMDASALAVQIAGLQSGLSYASIIDPSNDTESGSLLALTQLSVLVAFLAAGIHLEFLNMLLDSDELWRASFASAEAFVEFLKNLLRHSFQYGIRLGMPFVAILLLFDLASSLASRFAERFQLSGMLFPVKWVTTLLILLTSMATLHRLEIRMALQFLPGNGGR